MAYLFLCSSVRSSGGGVTGFEVTSNLNALAIIPAFEYNILFVCFRQGCSLVNISIPQHIDANISIS